jgi:hypothetical protein
MISEVLKKLREKPSTWSEIKEEFKKRTKKEIADSSLKSILDELKEYRIIKKDKDGRWWYAEHEIVVEKGYYNIVMKHSSLILPGFVDISRSYGGTLALERVEYVKLSNVPQITSYEYSYSPYSKEMIAKYAEEHLKTGYPEVYEAVNKAKESAKELEEETKSKEEEELRKIEENTRALIKNSLRDKIISIPHVEPNESYLELYVDKLTNKILSEAFHSIDYAKEVDWIQELKEEDVEAFFAGLPVFDLSVDDYKEYIKEEILKILPTVKENIKKYREVEKVESQKIAEKEKIFYKNKENADKELLKIVHKVFSGEPLKGKCSICPKVLLYFSSES